MFSIATKNVSNDSFCFDINGLGLSMTRQTSEAGSVNVQDWNIDVFAARLKEATKGKSAYSLERKTGIAESLIRKYMTGKSVPGTDKLILLARALGVSVTWLATGESDPVGSSLDNLTQNPPAAGLDLDLLERVATITFEELENRDLELEPAAKARLVRVLYRHFASRKERPDQDTVSNIIDLAAYR